MLNIFNTYRRYALTLKQINDLAKTDPAEFVVSSEEAYRSDIRDIATGILSSGYKCRVIMLAGPSGSGKTTSAKMLQEEFEKLGCHSEIISMDNFYLGAKNCPKTPEGKPDFETVGALNIALIEDCINNMLEYGFCEFNTFDFAKSEPGSEKIRIDLQKDSIAIIEGIHALNPIFTKNIRLPGGIKKIYISVKQGIKELGREGYLLTASELRLFRRIVRDHSFRSSSAEHTLDMWDNVLFGEKKYIVPYKYSGDITINSLHIYEPCVMSARIIPLLSEITPESPDYTYAQNLIERARKFEPISEGLVPCDSLMREFLGSGKYKY